MSPTRTAGNEPDPGDMSTEPGFGPPSDNSAEHDQPDDDVDKLGDFA